MGVKREELGEKHGSEARKTIKTGLGKRSELNAWALSSTCVT